MPEEKEVVDGNVDENEANESTENESQDSESNESDQDVIEKSLIDQDQEEDDEESSDEAGEKDAKKESTVYEMPELGEGVEFDTELFKTLTPVLQEMGAKQEDVNKLVETYANHVAKAAGIHGEQLIEKYNEIKNGWIKETKDALGAEYKPTLKSTGAALKQFGSPELIELLNETGVGNHIAVIRMLDKVGKHFVEDDFAEGNDGGGQETKAEDVLYSTMK